MHFKISRWVIASKFWPTKLDCFIDFNIFFITTKQCSKGSTQIEKLHFTQLEVWLLHLHQNEQQLLIVNQMSKIKTTLFLMHAFHSHCSTINHSKIKKNVLNSSLYHSTASSRNFYAMGTFSLLFLCVALLQSVAFCPNLCSFLSF